MKKRLFSVLMVFALAAALLPTAALASTETQDVEITYRGIRIELLGREITPVDAAGNPTEPFLLNNTTYLPVRAVAGALGLNVGWNEATSTITLNYGGEVVSGGGAPLATYETKSASITYRDIRLMVFGREIAPTDAAGNPTEPFLLNNTTYLPVRAVAGALGLDVGWDGETGTVILSRTYYLPTKESYTSVAPNGNSFSRTTEYVYNDNGDMLSEKISDSYGFSSETTYAYDDSGKRTLEEYADATGEYSRTVYSYDAAGDRLLAIVTENHAGAAVGRTDYSYDADGNLLSMTYSNAGGVLQSFSNVWNADGSLRSETSTYYWDNLPITNTREYTYDDSGNLSVVRELDGDGNVQTSYAYTYDARGRLASTRYEGYGYVSTREYAYDEAGRLLSEITNASDGSTSSEWSAYDANGNLLQRDYTDSDGVETHNISDYDARGNLLTEEYSDSDGIYIRSSYSYDADSHLLTQDVLENGYVTSYTYAYDANGNISHRTQSSEFSPIETWDYEYQAFQDRG